MTSYSNSRLGQHHPGRYSASKVWYSVPRRAQNLSKKELEEIEKLRNGQYVGKLELEDFSMLPPVRIISRPL